MRLDVAPPGEGQHVAVRYELGAEDALPDPLRVAFPTRWAGRDDLAEDILDVAVRVPGRTDARWEVRPDGTLYVHHGGARHVVVEYRVDPLRGLLSRETRFRALFDQHRLFAPGHALFAQPLDGAAEPVRVEATSRDSAWTLHSTLGRDVAHIDAFDAMLDAAWFAGRYREADVEGETGPIRVRVDPSLSVGTSEIAALAARIDAAQASLVGAGRTMTVVALRRADDPAVQAGSGRRGGYVLELGQDVQRVDDDLVALLAHENLHRLIGHDLVISGGPASDTAWFLEGVTDYLSLLTTTRAGVLPPERFFRRIGAALWADEANPARHLTSAERASRAWTDADAVRFGYDRGFLLGLALDVVLRTESGTSLEAWVQDLRDDPIARARPLTNAALLRALERFTSADWGTFWRAHVTGSESPPIRALLEEHGLRVVERLEPAPYLGARWSQGSGGDWAVTHVDPGSPAEAAGLRVGQALDAAPYVPEQGEVRLSVRTRSGVTDVRITPSLGQRRTYALIATGEEGLSGRLDLTGEER